MNYPDTLCEKYNNVLNEIHNYMKIYSHLNFFSGSFDTLGLTSYSTNSDGFIVLKGHNNWLWANILEDMCVQGMCYKKSVMSVNNKKVIINLYSVTPFDDKVTYGRSWIYTNTIGMKIKFAIDDFFRGIINYIRCYVDTWFTTRMLRQAVRKVQHCTSNNGANINIDNKNWLYFSILEQLTVKQVLRKKSVISQNRKRANIFYSLL
jgi:hypothetical protein